MAELTAALQLQRLLRLASPSRPVSTFASSEGLETAVETAWLRDADDVRNWLTAIVDECLARLNLPVFLRLHNAW